MQKHTEKGPPVTVQVTMLGGLCMQVDGKTLTDAVNRSQKLWNVLCYLLMNQGRNVTQAELIEHFWSEEGSANPGNALKTLLYRLRGLLAPLFPEGVEPIITQRGAYGWNRELACTLDADQFEALVQRAQNPKQSKQRRMRIYREAAQIYRGAFLPKLANEPWVVPLTARYQELFITSAKEYAALLEQSERFEEMTQLCLRASEMDRLDEVLHTLIVRGLLRQGKNADALKHYEEADDLLYQKQGVRPCEDLQALYVEIMEMEKGLEADLEQIQAGLCQVDARPGAFVCAYGFFKETYRLQVRSCLRNGTSIHVALLTVSLPDGGLPELGLLNATMEQLLEVLVGNLRRGDVVARYSSAQYVLMLPAANFEDSGMVLDRVVESFIRQERGKFLKVSYRIQQLDTDLQAWHV